MSKPDDIVKLLLRQHETAWRLTAYHLKDLSTDECLWRPGPKGLHVVFDDDGAWRGEWPEHEGYDLGPQFAQATDLRHYSRRRRI